MLDVKLYFRLHSKTETIFWWYYRLKMCIKTVFKYINKQRRRKETQIWQFLYTIVQYNWPSFPYLFLMRTNNFDLDRSIKLTTIKELDVKSGDRLNILLEWYEMNLRQRTNKKHHLHATIIKQHPLNSKTWDKHLEYIYLLLTFVL